MKLGSLFSGCGGLDMAVNSVFGSETAWHCEFEDAPSKVLASLWPAVPNHRDVTAVDWSQVEPVDILAGGFPCQDLSLAGRRAGMRPGTRSGLWSDFVKAIDALKPGVVVIENVRGLLSGCAEGGVNEDGSAMEPCPGCVGDGEHRPVLRALGRVLGDLANLGYDAEWGGIRAADVGAPHGRYRVFVVAYSERVRREPWGYAGSGETQGGWSSAVDSGCDRAPVELFRTPVADEDGGGPLHPDTAAERGQTLRLTGQVLALTGDLLPTPVTTDAKPVDVADQMATRNSPQLNSIAGLLGLPKESWEATDMTGNAGRQNGEAARRRDSLLPTPVAQPSGNSPEDHLRKKPGREVVTDLAIMAEHGLFESGGRLLPTPRATRDGSATETVDKLEEVVNWGPYEPAVRRWESLTRPAPAPVKPSEKTGKMRLSPEFVEWMQGYEKGHVTGHGLTRSEELRILGNTVVPQQGAEAIRQLWARAQAHIRQEVAA